MGFKAPVTIFKLKFSDEYEGLEVSVKSVPTGELMDLMRMAVGLGEKKSGDVGAVDMDAVSHLFSGFASALVEWNLEDDEGKPIPTDLDGIHGLEFGFVVHVIMTWVAAVSGVSKDLGKGLNSGGTSPEVPIPMEPL